MRRTYGLLTERQLEVLQLRRRGLSYAEIAEKLGTTPENIMILEKRAMRNIELAKATLEFACSGGGGARIELKPGTRMVDIPRIVMDEADKIGLKLKADFVRIYNEIRFKVGRTTGTLKRPVFVHLLPNGDIWVEAK